MSLWSRTLDFAQKWTGAVDWKDVKVTQKVLQDCNAFLNPATADQEGVRLRLTGYKE